MDSESPFYVRSSKSLTVEDVKRTVMGNMLIDGREWTQTEISNYFYRNVSSTLLHRALEELTAAGKVKWRKQKTSRHGRHALLWRAV